MWTGKKYMPGEEAPEFEPGYFGAKHVDKNIHPVPGREPINCVPYGNGIWREKIYYFMPDTPLDTAGQEIQTEYFLKQ